MRTAKTINDIAECMCDFDVKLRQDDSQIILSFPKNKYDYGKGIKTPIRAEEKPVNFALWQLLESSEFWRQTTVMDQLHRFWLNDGKSKHKIIRITKKASKPPILYFCDVKPAKEFVKTINKLMKDVEKISIWKRIKNFLQKSNTE